MTEVAKTAYGRARLATDEEVARETIEYFLAEDYESLYLVTDSEELLLSNAGQFGYTDPNLHRRIDNEEPVEIFDPTVDRSDYLLAKYGSTGEPDLDMLITSDNDLIITNEGDHIVWQEITSGNAYWQTNVVGVWDGIDSHRTVTTKTHYEGSTNASTVVYHDTNIESAQGNTVSLKVVTFSEIP